MSARGDWASPGGSHGSPAGAPPEPVSIRQRAFLHGTLEFRIDGGYVECSRRGIVETASYKIELAALNPNPVRRRVVPWGLVAAFALVGTLAAVLLGAGYLSGERDVRLAMAAIAVMPGVPAVVCLLGIIREAREMVMFEPLIGPAPVLQMLADKPDAPTCDGFIRELGRRIESARRDMLGGYGAGGVAGEIRELIKLRDEGLISDQEFRAAKAKALGLESWQIE